MDSFVKVVKPSARRLAEGSKQEKTEQSNTNRFTPYTKSKPKERTARDWKDKKRRRLLAPLVKDGEKPSSSTLTKHLLRTLADEANPITHSDIYSRTDHVTSTATGHQRGEGRPNQKVYLESRTKKLQDQLPKPTSAPEKKIMSGVRIYIDGYLEDTTDIEMKRIVALAGGRVLNTASTATHILTSQQLNGSKTHKFLHKKSVIKVQVVRPEWVTDSIEAGKRLPERIYGVVKDESIRSVAEMLSAGPSRDVSTV
ncbi:hypothetical protein BDW22DRAFT_1322121 [Trametopsis cervina]|nr:hypothetical protein BDW22DRAFT_1322121 [Trametopsis cervina]